MMRARPAGSGFRRPRAVRPESLARILATRQPGQEGRGKLIIGPLVFPCSLGRSGVTHRKREGDGATPAGAFAAVFVRHRADRLPIGRTLLPRRATRPDDGWCDDPKAASYNRPVGVPFAGSHEALWREDEVYDLVVVLDFNLRHPAKSRGSAIFLHVADSAMRPTAGCVAVRRGDLRRLLPRLSTRTKLVIQG